MTGQQPTPSGQVSIIIPTLNEEVNIQNCLNMVFKQKSRKKFAVTVIDSGSTDKTISILKRNPEVSLIEILPAEFRHGRTRNLALGFGKTSYLVFLNADAIPVNECWLENLLLPFDQDSEIAAVYSRHLPKRDCFLYTMNDMRRSMGGKKITRNHQKRFDSLLFSTVSGAVRRKVLEKIPFDDSIDIAEDQNWARRILKVGYKIAYAPESVVYHSHNYSLKTLFYNKIRNGKSLPFFKHRINAVLFGPFLVFAGMIRKIWLDIIFIAGYRDLPWKKKTIEILRSLSGRAVSFAGKYIGWIQK